MTMDPKELAFSVNGALMQAVMSYLAQRPWGEVAAFMNGLQASPQIENQKPE
jgi:hypothetical protein